MLSSEGRGSEIPAFYQIVLCKTLSHGEISHSHFEYERCVTGRNPIKMHLCELPYATDAYNFFPLILLWDERSDLCWRVKFPCHFLKATLIRTYVCITFGEKKYKNCNNKANYSVLCFWRKKRSLPPRFNWV